MAVPRSDSAHLEDPWLGSCAWRAGIARSLAVSLLVAPPELVFLTGVLQSGSSATFVSAPSLVLSSHRQSSDLLVCSGEVAQS